MHGILPAQPTEAEWFDRSFPLLLLLHFLVELGEHSAVVLERFSKPPIDRLNCGEPYAEAFTNRELSNSSHEKLGYLNSPTEHHVFTLCEDITEKGMYFFWFLE